MPDVGNGLANNALATGETTLVRRSMLSVDLSGTRWRACWAMVVAVKAGRPSVPKDEGDFVMVLVLGNMGHIAWCSEPECRSIFLARGGCRHKAVTNA